VNEHIYTPSELNRLARMALEERFPGIWVRGEVSRPKLGPTGHLYFTLKDSRAALDVVQLRGALPLPYVPKEGEEVLAYGTVSIYEPQGRYQLRARVVRPAGIGLLHRELLALKARLEAEGLFAPERKRPLPRFPRRVGVVTSPRGAAIRDIARVAARRWPLAELYLFSVRVQGEGAELEIAQAIEDAGLFHRERALDLLIVGRGGGSLEDLWAFNSEAVARAIFACPVPVVSGVGHEVDWTIADLVADVRAPTPSAAAEIALPDAGEVLAGLETKVRRMQAALLAPLERAERALNRILARRPFRDPGSLLRDREERLARALSRPPFKRPGELLAPYKTRLAGALSRRPFRVPLAPVDELAERLDVTAGRLISALRPLLLRASARAEALTGRLESAGPLAVLQRGYSLTLGPDGRPLKRANAVQVEEEVETILAEGRLRSRVEEVWDDPRREAGSA
jgi:exodeoxyribonuclease VII large subunit